jgi:hypothetical protein
MEHAFHTEASFRVWPDLETLASEKGSSTLPVFWHVNLANAPSRFGR